MIYNAMKKFLMPLLVIPALIITSCSEPLPEDGVHKINEVKTKTVSATEWGQWVYFSFETDDVVGTGATTLADDALWAARADWDIAFHKGYIKTNNGTSGTGVGGVVEMGTTAPTYVGGRDITFNALTIAPLKGYQVDIINEDYGKQGMVISVSPVTFYKGSYNKPMSAWTIFSPDVLQYTVFYQKVFVLKTTNGKYAKIYLTGFTDKFDENQGTITFSYVFQADGSINLKSQ